eukprot:m.635438 g.635438  ORF g.635438 m.635438 type:complete len:1042 (+) comp22583_c0_seq8:411-3536(+)
MALPWSEKVLRLSQPDEVMIGRKKTLMFYLFLDGHCAGSFNYTTAQALAASLSSMKLTNRLPKFPTRASLTTTTSSKHQQSYSQKLSGIRKSAALEEYLQSLLQDPIAAASGPTATFMNGLRPVAVGQSERVKPGLHNDDTCGPPRRAVSLSELSVDGRDSDEKRNNRRRFFFRRNKRSDVDDSLGDGSDAAESTGGKRNGQRKMLSRMKWNSTSLLKDEDKVPEEACVRRYHDEPDGSDSQASVTSAPPTDAITHAAASSAANSVHIDTGSGSAGSSGSDGTAAADATHPPNASDTCRTDVPTDATPTDVTPTGASSASRVPHRPPSPALQDLQAITLVDDLLCCVHSQWECIPAWLPVRFAATITKVDVSHSNFADLSPLSAMVCLQSLVADANGISDAELPLLPCIPGLRTLSLNQNRIASVLAFVGFCLAKSPDITFVSLIGNPCCPSEAFSGGSPAEYGRYRKQLLLGLSQLGWIDSASTADDRMDDTLMMSCPSLTSFVIPTWVTDARDTVCGLDFSYGALQDLSHLGLFHRLQTLVLDHNGLQDLDSFPAMQALRALSLNHNVLDNLDLTIIAVQAKCPSLTFLSLLGNPCCPWDSKRQDYHAQCLYERYRAKVMMALPQVQFLDFRSTGESVEIVPDWLVENVTLEQATQIVTNADPGSFIVFSALGNYMLVVNDFGLAATFRVSSSDSGLSFRFAGKTFYSIEAVVDYTLGIELRSKTGKPLKLTQPVTLEDDCSAFAAGSATAPSTTSSPHRTTTTASERVALDRDAMSLPWETKATVSAPVVTTKQPQQSKRIRHSRQHRRSARFETPAHHLSESMMSDTDVAPAVLPGGDDDMNEADAPTTATDNAVVVAAVPSPVSESDLPPGYGWDLLKCTLAASLSTLQECLFGGSVEWWMEYYRQMKYSEISTTPWNGRRRNINYTIPKSRLVSKIVVQEEHHILVDTTQHFVVQVTTRTPGVPFGGHFATLVQYKLLCHNSSETRVEVTGGVQWLKSCALKGTITKKLRSGLTKGFANIADRCRTAWKPVGTLI